MHTVFYMDIAISKLQQTDTGAHLHKDTNTQTEHDTLTKFETGTGYDKSPGTPGTHRTRMTK